MAAFWESQLILRPFVRGLAMLPLEICQRVANSCLPLANGYKIYPGDSSSSWQRILKRIAKTICNLDNFFENLF
jgi:hypothetical protein